MLSDAERAELREKIKSDLEKINESIEELKEQCKPISPENSLGRITRMDAINNKSVNEAALRQAKMKKSRLEVAMNKIEIPEFGICARCKNGINPKRLMYMPESNKCVRCADL